MPRFSIDGKVYESKTIAEVPLKDLILFNTQAADMGLRERWNDIERVASEMDGLTPDEAEEHPDKLLVFAVSIWVTRRAAGENLTLDQALDVPLSSITIIPDPADKKPKANPTKQRKPQASAADDAQGDEPAADPSE